jgi:hypothetical protein
MKVFEAHQPPVFLLPGGDEMEAFLDAVPETLFGVEYVNIAGTQHEFFLCDVRAKTADGTVLHARVLPFN